MISREEAQERLKAFRNPKHSAEQIARLEKLPSNISTIGQILIQDGPAWKKLEKDLRRGREIREDVSKEIAMLDSKQRQSLFAALFPAIAPFLEDAWNLFDHLPYQDGSSRRPFRSPRQPLFDARITIFERLVFAIKGYEQQDICWLAAWAPHLGYYGPDVLGYVFAAAIDKGGKTGNEVFDILVSSANGAHETGAMGRHVVRGLVCSSRVDGWEFIERMLLAAQREEGLRQVILEAIDEAHPQAFRRMLRMILDQNLIRFSAAARAFGVWFGLPFDAVNQKVAHNVLEQVLVYLDSPSEREKAIRTGGAQDAYYALWSLAFDDVSTAFPQTVALSHSPDVEKRFAAAHLLGQMKLKEGLPELIRLLDDDDLRIVASVLPELNVWEYNGTQLADSDLFERLERLIPRVKHKQNNLNPLVWDWLPITLNRELVSGKLIDCLGTRSPKRLIPYLSLMNPYDRYRVARVLNELKQKDQETLQTLLLLVGDLSPHVREEALKGLHTIRLQDTDIIRLEELLSRKAEDLRRGIIQLLLELSDQELLASIRRLVHHNGENQRSTALELLRECKRKERLPEQVRELALEYKQRANLSITETNLLNETLAEAVEKYSLEDSLGLMNPQNRTKPAPVKAVNSASIKLGSPAAAACLKSLDALVEEHRNDVIGIQRGGRKVTELLGNIQSGWWLYWEHEDYSGFPLRDLTEAWWQARPQELQDKDGNELIRAFAAISLFERGWSYDPRPKNHLSKEVQAHFDLQMDFDLNYVGIVQAMIEWLISMHPTEGETDFILGALEESVVRIPYAELTGLKKEQYWATKVRTLSQKKLVFLKVARWYRGLRPSSWKDTHHARLWKVVCWLNEPEPHLPGGYMELDDALFAYQAGAATHDDLLNMFMGSRDQDGYRGRADLMREFSARKLHPQDLARCEKFPILKEIVDACRERVLDVECKRGELPTAATGVASSIRSVPGMRNLFRLLVALGDTGFERGYLFGESRSAVFSHLIRNSYPVEADRIADFVEQARVNQIQEKRLIELAIYAPQWAAFVQQATGWDYLTDAVWWLYAHTKDRQWTVETNIREEWAVRISEYTPLSADDLMDGAVDVAWFQRVYAEIGEGRWSQLYEAALYTSGGIGHGRARLFADAMLGQVTAEQLSERIKKKRHQDSVRALGLIPLAGKKDQKNEILRRYEVMQEFLRTSRKFGSQRQASEKLAVAIGMQNLARTAGYVDPQRLEWAMEIEAITDLAAGPVHVQVDEYQFTLGVNDLGEPVLETAKKGRAIKTIPSAVKKNERVSALLERKRMLDRQVSRMRLSLEQAMCRGDQFTAAELRTLFRHPMLKAMLEQLIFVSSQGLGYPVRSGKALFRHDGKEIALVNNEQLRIAHSLDLLESQEWHLWQHECFVAERIQPFKQVFRELYVLTSTEKEEENRSRRYAGHQVNPQQAVALFGGRGWVVDPNEGVQKTFHAEGISARVGFLQGMFTPAEVEGSTIEVVAFTRRDDWKPLKLEEIPPRIFSEVMRDLDLVVSVAHAGGVDPESSASSVEARSALIRETCSLLKLGNVQLSERHVIIDGKLANYNVNLGSGVVHKQPGGALCIIPVHSQHRGRIFLPFVDNDPKTAEIVSKVILLARDEQIKDPTILEQIL